LVFFQLLCVRFLYVWLAHASLLEVIEESQENTESYDATKHRCTFHGYGRYCRGYNNVI